MVVFQPQLTRALLGWLLEGIIIMYYIGRELILLFLKLGSFFSGWRGWRHFELSRLELANNLKSWQHRDIALKHVTTWPLLFSWLRNTTCFPKHQLLVFHHSQVNLIKTNTVGKPHLRLPSSALCALQGYTALNAQLFFRRMPSYQKDKFPCFLDLFWRLLTKGGKCPNGTSPKILGM